MKRVATLFALLLSASAASAYTYQIDNGNYADSWTFTNGNTTWANHFTAVSGNNVIDKVLIAFGDNSNQNMNGQSVTIKLWNDPNGDGNPSDAVLLTSYLGTVANAGTTLFNEFDIANTAVASSFFVGASLVAEYGTTGMMYPASIDDQLGVDSWLWSGDDPSNAYNIGTVYERGSFMVRATTVDNSVPEPGSLALLGIGLAGLGGFRRKQQ